MKSSKKQGNKERARAAKTVRRDDFVSVARRLGADEDKGRFEKKLGKIVKAKPMRDSNG